MLQLWEAVHAFDACTKMHFKLHGALHWTVNDYPTYANLSGWSTKGHFSCPSGAKGIQAVWLENRHKFCYMGHRRWLPKDHPFWYDVGRFDGNVEHDLIQSLLVEVPCELEGTTCTYSKGETQHMDTNKKDD